jgi:hypothetical protein
MNKFGSVQRHRNGRRSTFVSARFAFYAILLLLWILLPAACRRGQDEPTPVAAESPAVATQALATEIPTQPPSPLPSPTPQATPSATATGDANGATAVFTPLQVDEGIDCEIESHIDLAGYPNLEQTMGCPTGPATLDPVAINEFGPGPEFDRFMLWFSNLQQIYVLLPDGSWQSYPDTWQEGDPVFSCNPLDEEPESPPLPRRGFGKLWCSDPELQEVMGTIPKEERLCQHSVMQPFAGGRLLACFEDATIRYFRLLDDNTWDVVEQ